MDNAQITFFNIEMQDYDEGGDTSTLRISHSDTNCEIAIVQQYWMDDGSLALGVISPVIAMPSKLTAAIRSALSAEMNVHQSGPKGHEIETMRDLLAVCTPSGTVQKIALAAYTES